MKLSAEVALSVASGLRGLDGHERVVKDGGNERVVMEYYKLGGGLRLLIAVNLNKLDEFQRGYQRVMQALQLEVAGPDGKPDVLKLPAMVQRQQEVNLAEQEFDLKPIKISELKLEENSIPSTILSLIFPLLDEG